jgi:hypothetical protein
MSRWSASFLRIIFAFVIVFLAGAVSVAVRVGLRTQSDRITGIAFLVAVVCLVLLLERIFPSVYSRSAKLCPRQYGSQSLKNAILTTRNVANSVLRQSTEFPISPALRFS